MKVWVYKPRDCSDVEVYTTIDPILESMKYEIEIADELGWEWDFRSDTYQPHISVDDDGGQAWLCEVKGL